MEARLRGAELLVAIENDQDPEAPAARSSGLGLANVRLRLQARYGAGARLEVRAAPDRFRVELSLPAETEEQP